MQNKLTQGQRIRQMRLEHRYTQEYVAAQLSTTKQAIYKYEADLIKSIPTDKLLRLSQLFDCSPAWLQALSEERGLPPEGYPTFTPVDAPLGTPHFTKSDAAMHTQTQSADDQFAFYRDFMDVMLQLTPPERYSVMQFAKFMAAQHAPKPAEPAEGEA